ncbi:MAG: response regulator [Gemmatimonadaceae bacterium]
MNSRVARELKAGEPAPNAIDLHDGTEAVATAAAYLPDVILLDIGRLKMNRYDACSAVRQQPWGKKNVIIALTGWGQDADRRKANETGFDGHLVKPVEYRALMRLLAESQARYEGKRRGAQIA